MYVNYISIKRGGAKKEKKRYVVKILHKDLNHLKKKNKKTGNNLNVH